MTTCILSKPSKTGSLVPSGPPPSTVYYVTYIQLHPLHVYMSIVIALELYDSAPYSRKLIRERSPDGSIGVTVMAQYKPTLK